MQIQEIKNERFFKEYKVTIPFHQINEKVEERVAEAAKTFRMPGFREGKVPLSIVRQKVGKEETGRQIQEHVSSSIGELIESKNLNPSSKPNVEIESFDEENGLCIKVSFEVLPELPEIKWEEFEIEKININISDDEIKKTKDVLLREFRKYAKTKDDYAAKMGDKVNIDFHGQVDGKDFDGNSSTDMDLVLGEGYFLEDFEKQLVGCKVGEEKSFELIFPKDYPQEDLASKTAVFKVKVNQIMELEPIQEVDAEMLKKLGLESEARLDELIKQKLNMDSMHAIRTMMKKELFDQIDAKYDFELPNKMVEQDFDIIWKEVEKNKETDENLKNRTEEDLLAEYKKISKRRVKLGLVLADVSRRNQVNVSDEELQNIIEIQANQNPQLKHKILEFYRNSENLEKIRGPILEEKALDVILSKVTIKNKDMTSEEFIDFMKQNK
ncbi:trigger factor [Candidatus Bandiella euplotis]|uniref:Trigger factor n=1 Tax=Candidatus Bandiella euplotis TaxID=1664265 RepID=A0ABZ0UL75_9RICK|nr:trigger factor [Candidatus Bandiella woodruffii]WPX96895.1 Trigger factor [Candidatus Bandiella woodruffii]